MKYLPLSIILIDFVLPIVAIRIVRRYISNATLQEEWVKTRRSLMTEVTRASDHFITNLPGLTSSIVQYSGHLLVDDVNKGYLFYWLFETPNNSKNAPLLIWLNGGPGCSSMDGLFLEMGPIKLDGNRVFLNEDSWLNVANLLFIDQPVGTGLSFTQRREGYAKNDGDVNRHFYRFLQQFLKLHDRYTRIGEDGRRYSRKLFLTGESHAGHYIPSFAVHVLRQNANALDNKMDKSSIAIDLGGIALGNPWIDPINQYDASEFVHGLGLITQGQRKTLAAMEQKCKALLRQGKLNSRVCFALLDDIIDSSTVPGGSKLLMYDARQFVASPQLFPPGHEAVENFLNREDVRRALHASSSPHKFVECSDPPYNALSHQDGKGVTEEIITLLEAGIRFLVFSGQYDVICNHLGIEKSLRGLKWSGREGWIKTQPGIWMFQNQVAGYVKAFRSLVSVVVLNSGHMVPMDRPKQSLEMISKFIRGLPIGSSYSKLKESFHSEMECPPVENITALDISAKGSEREIAGYIAVNRSPSLFFHSVESESAGVRVEIKLTDPFLELHHLELELVAHLGSTVAVVSSIRQASWVEDGCGVSSINVVATFEIPSKPEEELKSFVRLAKTSQVLTHLGMPKRILRFGCYHGNRVACCGNGVCLRRDDGSNQCLCASGIVGHDCNEAIESLSPIDCKSNALLTNWSDSNSKIMLEAPFDLARVDQMQCSSEQCSITAALHLVGLERNTELSEICSNLGMSDEWFILDKLLLHDIRFALKSEGLWLPLDEQGIVRTKFENSKNDLNCSHVRVDLIMQARREWLLSAVDTLIRQSKDLDSTLYDGVVTRFLHPRIKFSSGPPIYYDQLPSSTSSSMWSQFLFKNGIHLVIGVTVIILLFRTIQQFAFGKKTSSDLPRYRVSRSR